YLWAAEQGMNGPGAQLPRRADLTQVSTNMATTAALANPCVNVCRRSGRCLDSLAQEQDRQPFHQQLAGSVSLEGGEIDPQQLGDTGDYHGNPGSRQPAYPFGTGSRLAGAAPTEQQP